MMFSVASFIQAEIETVGTTVIPAERVKLSDSRAHIPTCTKGFSSPHCSLLCLSWSVPSWPVRLSWLESCPVDQNAVGSISGQVTYPGCELFPGWGVYEKATNSCFSLTSLSVSVSLSVSLCLSLSLSSLSPFFSL